MRTMESSGARSPRQNNRLATLRRSGAPERFCEAALIGLVRQFQFFFVEGDHKFPLLRRLAVLARILFHVFDPLLNLLGIEQKHLPEVLGPNGWKSAQLF